MLEILYESCKKRLAYLRDYFSVCVVLQLQKLENCVLEKLLIFHVMMKLLSFAFVFAI